MISLMHMCIYILIYHRASAKPSLISEPEPEPEPSVPPPPPQQPTHPPPDVQVDYVEGPLRVPATEIAQLKLRNELSDLPVGALQKRALADGVESAAVSAAVDPSDWESSRAAVIELIVAERERQVEVLRLEHQRQVAQAQRKSQGKKKSAEPRRRDNAEISSDTWGGNHFEVFEEYNSDDEDDGTPDNNGVVVDVGVGGVGDGVGVGGGGSPGSVDYSLSGVSIGIPTQKAAVLSTMRRSLSDINVSA
eukprot:COSAG05_NODE_1315_length_5211_cov_2.184077_6_plen_249_part_00